MNKSQMAERIRELEAFIAEGVSMGASIAWKHAAERIVARGNAEERKHVRAVRGNVTLGFHHDCRKTYKGVSPERQESIMRNLLNSFDRAGIGASMSLMPSWEIEYEEKEVSDWVNIYYDAPTTKAERIVKRWMKNSAKVGYTSRIA
jgi:hypothetical protein